MKAAMDDNMRTVKIETLGIQKARADSPIIFAHLKKLVERKTKEIRMAFGFSGVIVSENNVCDRNLVCACRYDKACNFINEKERTIYLSSYLKELSKLLPGIRLPEPKLGAEVVIKREEYIT